MRFPFKGFHTGSSRVCKGFIALSIRAPLRVLGITHSGVSGFLHHRNISKCVILYIRGPYGDLFISYKGRTILGDPPKKRAPDLDNYPYC